MRQSLSRPMPRWTTPRMTSNLKETTKKAKEDIIKEVMGRWSMKMREREARRGNLVIYGLKEPEFSIKSGTERQAVDKHITSVHLAVISVRVNNNDVKFTARISKLTPAIYEKSRPFKSASGAKMSGRIFSTTPGFSPAHTTATTASSLTSLTKRGRKTRAAKDCL